MAVVVVVVVVVLVVVVVMMAMTTTTHELRLIHSFRFTFLSLCGSVLGAGPTALPFASHFIHFACACVTLREQSHGSPGCSFASRCTKAMGF